MLVLIPVPFSPGFVWPTSFTGWLVSSSYCRFCWTGWDCKSPSGKRCSSECCQSKWLYSPTLCSFQKQARGRVIFQGNFFWVLNLYADKNISLHSFLLLLSRSLSCYWKAGLIQMLRIIMRLQQCTGRQPRVTWRWFISFCTTKHPQTSKTLRVTLLCKWQVAVICILPEISPLALILTYRFLFFYCAYKCNACYGKNIWKYTKI